MHGLRAQVQHLEDEARLGAQALKDAKFEVQQIMELKQRKEDEAHDLACQSEDHAAATLTKRAEEERVRQLIAQMREELGKGRREAGLIKEQTDNMKEKTLKTHSYLRNLLREEGNIN